MSRFAIRRDALWRPFLPLIRATAARSFVELGDDELVINFGVAVEHLPLAQVVAVEDASEWRLLYGIGVRIGAGGIGYVGSHKDVVKITLSDEHEFKVLFKVTMGFSLVFVSLEEPAAFIAALRSRIAAHP